MWSGAQGEFGGTDPVRPGVERPRRCLRGHLLELAGINGSWSHLYSLPTTSCDICQALERERPQERKLASWAQIDPSNIVDAADAKQQHGLILVKIPPAIPRTAGQIALHLDNRVVGDLDVVLCSVEKRAVLEHVRVDEQHRRRGYGRVLVAAALALVPDDYSWSTTAINRTIVAKAFWATVGVPGPATSEYCSHMCAASTASW